LCLAEAGGSADRVRDLKYCNSKYSVFREYPISNIQYSIPSGFSLLELIVVLVIIGMVSAFVGPKLVGSMTNMNLKTASKKVAASLRYARSQAVSEGSDYVARFDLEANRVSIVSAKRVSEGSEADGGDGAGVDVEEKRGGGRLKVYELPDGVVLIMGISGDTETDSGIFEIIFLSDGGSSGGEVILVNERERAYMVAVDFITGAVRVERYET